MVNRAHVTAGIAFALATTLGVGVTSAATHSSAISACANKSSGALRIAKKCASNERHVTLNARGRRGPKGARGPAGSTFLASDEGVKLGSVTFIGATADLPLTGLPNGSYALTVSVNFDNENTSTFYAKCDIDGSSLGADPIEGQQSSVVPPAQDAYKPGTITLTGAFTKSTDTVLEIYCTSGDGASDLTATIDAEFTPVGAIVPLGQ